MTLTHKISAFVAAAVLLCGCNMDFYRSDTMTSTQLKSDASAAVYSTDGNYSMFKDILEYKGTEDSGLSFIKMWEHMSEMRGDNALLSGKTSSPIYNSACYDDNPTLKHSYYFWWCAYKIIYSANAIIEMLPEGESAANDHLLGENYFMRAFCHLCLSCLYSKQYPLGRDNPGVVLRTSTDCSVTERATVGQVYDQIVSDLEKAATLMKGGTRRGDAGYISYEAAMGLLSRVYLYMEDNDAVLAIADEILGADPASHLDPDVANYFINARSSKETLWCVACTPTDTRNRSSLGSMYFSPDGTGGTGWGEVYWSDPLIQLFKRYPTDLRFQSYFSQYGKIDDGKVMVYWPIDDGKNNFRSDAVVTDVTKNGAGKYEFTYGGHTYQVETATVNTYPVNYITGFCTDAEDDDDFVGGTVVYVTDNADKVTGIRNSFPQFYMSKFSWQDGDPNLSSPVMLRWAEVILNRAEANAKKGNDQAALDDVNILRKRAGLPNEAMMTLTNYATRGYASVLDVVLDERRLELCFEAHRPFDQIRNKRSIDHRYGGIQPWEVIDYNDDRFLFAIPQDEILVSGIPQNPGKGM